MAKKDRAARDLAAGVEEHLTPADRDAIEALEGPSDGAIPEEAAPAVEEPAPARSPKPDVTELPSREPQLTAERMFVARKADPVVEAFLHVERLRPEGVRKMPRAAWLAELEKFKSAPRG